MNPVTAPRSAFNATPDRSSRSVLAPRRARIRTAPTAKKDPTRAAAGRDQRETAAQPEAIEEYDRRLAAFQAEQGMPPDLWTQRCIARVRTPQSLTNRHRMREALGNLGFRFL